MGKKKIIILEAELEKRIEKLQKVRNEKTSSISRNKYNFAIGELLALKEIFPRP